VDYSHRSDIDEVVEITQEQYIEETKPIVIEEETPVLIDEEIIEDDEDVSE
jgi:hypothetical protein